MAAKKKSKFENKFRSTAASESRTANVRDERKVKDEQPKLSFNFKDFDFNQCPPGQTLEKWQEEKMLDKLVGRFVEVCSFTRQEAVQQGLLKVYGDFPENSHFKIPPHIKGKVSWGTIRKIGGQKPACRLHHRICILSCILGQRPSVLSFYEETYININKNRPT